MTSSRVLALCMVLALGPVLAASVDEDPLDRRMLEIARELRCTQCQNQPISESNAPLAQDMRAIIREQLEAGKSRAEIMQYFADRYGNYVLMKPPARGATVIVWVLPGFFAVILALAAFVYLRRRHNAVLPPPPELSAAERERVRRAREEMNS